MGWRGGKNGGGGNRPAGQEIKGVAMLGTMPPVRALSSYCLELARAVADLGRVQFISFKKIYPTVAYPGRDLSDDHTFPPLDHGNLKINRRLTWYNPVTWVMEGLRTPADLLHAQWWSLPLFLVYGVVCLGFRVRRKPVVFTVHNVLPHEKSKIHDMVVRVLFHMGEHFVVHSNANRTQLIRYYGIGPERVTVIPHGPLDLHVKTGRAREAARREMGFDPENRVVLLFGAVRPYKGIETALQAFVKVLKEVPEARLLVAGKPWQPWDPYQQWVEALGIGAYVRTDLRYIPSGEVHRFFEACDLVVLPYQHFDSQSGVGATAVSFRKPLIVSDVGGLSDLVRDKRYVVAPKDPGALAEAMIHALRDKERLQKMSADMERVAESMTWQKIAEKTWSVYCKALGHKDHPLER